MSLYPSKLIARIITFLSLLLLTAQSISANDNGAVIIDRWVSQSKSNSVVDVTYNKLSYENDTLIIEDLSIIGAWPPNADGMELFAFDIKIPKLKLSNLSENQAHYSAQRMSADTIRLRFTSVLLKLDLNAKYNTLVIDNMKWAKLPEIADDPAQPISQYYPLVLTLSDISMSSMRIGYGETEMMLDQANLSVSTYFDQLKSGPVQQGNFSSIAYDKFDVLARNHAKIRNEGDKSLTLNLAEVNIRDYNFGTLIRLFDPAQALSQPDTAYQTMIGAVDVEKTAISTFSPKTSGALTKLGTVRIVDVGVRPAATHLLAQLDEWSLQKDTISPNSKAFLDSFTSLAGMLKLGTFQIQHAVFQGQNKREGQLDRFQITGLSSAGLDEFVLNGFRYGNRDYQVSLDKFQVSHIGFPQLSALMNVDTAIKRKDIKAVVDALPIVRAIELTNLDFGMTFYQLKLESYRLNMDQFVGRLPTKIFQERKFELSRKSISTWSIYKPLVNTDYDNIRFSEKSLTEWNEDQETFNISYQTGVEDSFELSINLQFGEISRAVFDNPNRIKQDYLSWTFNKLEFDFYDDSFIEKFLANAAIKNNTTVENTAQKFLSDVPANMSMFASEDAKFITDLTAALTALLQGEADTLSLRINPDPPFTFAEIDENTKLTLEQERQMLERMRIEISTE